MSVEVTRLWITSVYIYGKDSKYRNTHVIVPSEDLEESTENTIPIKQQTYFS